MMNCTLGTRLDLLRPDVATHVHKKQAGQKQYNDKNRHFRSFTIGQQVMARDFCHNDKWACGKIVNQLGPVSYLIRCNDGDMWRRHIDHIQQLNPSQEQTDNSLRVTITGQDNTEATTEAFTAIYPQTDTALEPDVTNLSVSSTAKTIQLLPTSLS